MTLPAAEVRRRIGWCLGYLSARRDRLYGTGPGSRPRYFSLESHYDAYDGMLKRHMLYARLGVREEAASLRISVVRRAVTLVLRQDPALYAAPGGPGPFEDFLVLAGYLTRSLGGGLRLTLADYEGDLAPVPGAPGTLAFRSPPLRRRATSQGRYVPSARSEVESWARAAFAEWSASRPDLLAEASRPLALRSGAAECLATRRVSQVDVDASGEPVPHAFRWLEKGLAALSSHADLPEADRRGVLRDQDALPPPDASPLGGDREDLGKGAACLLLRWEHLLPDPDPSPDGSESADPPHLSRGSIVVENDYREARIDAGSRKVIGEARKWRPVSVTAAARDLSPA